jgi:serine/threonine protein kinase
MLDAGDKLGPYEILSPIGAGGMGEVYKARDTRLDRTVAIKISKEKFSERFEREARSIAALNHPHICQLYDVGPDYLVMEYIDGAPLKGPLPLDQAMKYAGQICDAPDAAHKKGITHRDLKPANIMVTKVGVKLLDFGLARIAAGAGDETVTMAVMGTPAYMSPEQWEGKPGDARSDIYSFGCVLYEMLTGKRVPQQARVPLDPPALDSVVGTCLEQNPDDRWQSARDIKSVLAMPAARPVKSKSGWWILAAAGIVLAVIGGWMTAHFRSPTVEDRVFRLDINPPEGGQMVLLGNSTGGAAFSPDGKSIASSPPPADAAGSGSGPSMTQPLD